MRRSEVVLTANITGSYTSRDVCPLSPRTLTDVHSLAETNEPLSCVCVCTQRSWGRFRWTHCMPFPIGSSAAAGVWAVNGGVTHMRTYGMYVCLCTECTVTHKGHSQGLD